jgi:predicted metal-dependent hydrolase
MNPKKDKIRALTQAWTGHGWDARYLGYFECFNQGRFYEAHDVLEDLWLEARGTGRGDFYKALIQLAGAFVHLQKDRLPPAAALLRRAVDHLRGYPAAFEGVHVPGLLALAEEWIRALEGGGLGVNPLRHRSPPRLAWPVGIGPGLTG